MCIQEPKSVIVRMSRNRRRSSVSGGLIEARTSHMEKSDVLKDRRMQRRDDVGPEKERIQGHNGDNAVCRRYL